ncbi:protein kinase C delta isoform X3 [Rhynchophorus ferrugineus]|uniref:protein kinase C delta isoform X3 n=1 Tax=Rhynchophorus ferrugineus TaxID=354439 RepID=UPI003FCD581C
MPYYSELGIYTPSSSYTSPLIKGPYSNHSSIIASNILPLPKQIHRSNFRGFKPHLTTISEANATAPLRRISSPKVIYHSSPKVRVQRPIKINTADIDVSVNKYNNYVERGSAEKRSPTSRSEPPPVQPEKEAKPNTNIRRDRATIRLQTIHKDALEKEIGTIKSWRDKFKPEELVTEARVKRKSPGEKLKEKFLIKSKSKEKIPHTETPKLTRRPSVKKSASFKDICNVITSDRAIEDLNPGQPIDIRRRQSRQVSHEDIIKEIERTSSNLSQEEVELLDALIKAENEVGLYETPPIIDDKPKTRKKKVTRKKTVEGLIKKTDKSDLPSAETDGAVKKSVSEGNVLDGASSKLRKDSSLQNMVKDISQVEIEMIPVKQKPIITGSVGDIDENAKSKLKLVVEDYQVHESPTPPKKEKKFRFNVTVEEFPVKKKIHFPKQKLSDQDYGVMHLPQAKPLVLNNLMKKNISKHTGTVTEEPKIFKRKEPPVEEAKMKKKLLKSLSEIQVRNKNDNSLQKSGSNDSMCSNFTVLVNKSKSDEGFTAGDSRTSSGKLKIISIEKNLTDKNNAAASLIKTTRKDLKENTFLSKGDLGQKKPQPLWAQRNKAAKTINITSSVEEKLKISPKNNLEEKVIAPETQSPFSDKLPEALDENKITLELKKSEPLLAPENKKEENVHGSSKEDVVEVDLSKIASTEVETKEIQSPTTKTTCVEDTVTETLTLDVEKQASTVETKGTEIKEIQSPVSDKTTDGVLDENKQNKFLSKVDPQKKKPLWAQRNEAAKLLNKSKSLEDKVKETPILDVNKQAAAVEKKDDEIKEIQSPVSDKTTDGVLDENKQNKFLSKVDPQQKKPLWAQRNEAAKMLNKSKSLEDKVKETPILDVNKQAAAVEKKDDEIKEIQSPVSDKTTDGVLDENKQNKFLSKVDLGLNKSTLEDKIKETPKKAPAVDSLKTETKEVETKQIQSLDSDKLTEKVTPSVNNLIQNETIMIEPDAGDKVAEEAVTATATSNQSTLRQNSGPVEVKSSTEELKPPLESKQDEIKDLKNEKREELVPQKCEIETKKSKEPKQPPETADTQLDDFWTDTDSVPYEPPVLGRLTLDISEPEPESLEEVQQKMTSKRSLIQKANKDDPDLKIFEPPTPPPQEPVKEPSPEPSFVPLQSNRLSQWMHPWKKPEQKDDGQVELFAKPKFIRARHIPRRWQQNVNSESEDSTTTDDEDSSGEDSEEDEDGEEEAEEEEVEDEEDAGGENKIGASTSSTDSGFESGRTKNKGTSG